MNYFCFKEMVQGPLAKMGKVRPAGQIWPSEALIRLAEVIFEYLADKFDEITVNYSLLKRCDPKVPKIFYYGPRAKKKMPTSGLWSKWEGRTLATSGKNCLKNFQEHFDAKNFSKWSTFSQFHQYHMSSFCANILSQKKYKAKLNVEKSCTKHLSTKRHE